MRRVATAVMAVAVIAGALSVAAGQQVRRTETGTVTADLIEYDFGTNDFTATGNAHVTILGRHNAQIRAPKLTMDLSDQLDRILRLEAAGPVRFEVVTAPDDEGLRRQIEASATQSAVYVDETQTVTLTGDAVADVRTLPEGEVEAARFEGQSIVVNLAKSTLSVRQAKIEVTSEVEEE